VAFKEGFLSVRLPSFLRKTASADFCKLSHPTTCFKSGNLGLIRSFYHCFYGDAARYLFIEVKLFFSKFKNYFYLMSQFDFLIMPNLFILTACVFVLVTFVTLFITALVR
jgi:hypothetical protein